MSPEVIRADPEVQTACAEMMDRIIMEIADHLPCDAPKLKRKAKAWAFLSTLIGGLRLARAAGIGPAADNIERASEAAALGALGAQAA